MPAATAAVMEAAPPDRGGIASGVINAARQAGTVLGVALLGHAGLDPVRVRRGLHAGIIVAAAAFFIAAGLAWAAPAVHRRPRPSIGR